MNKKMIPYIAAAVVLILVFVAAAIVYKSNLQKNISFLASEQSEIFVRDYSPRYGNEDAKVILTEFLDPECESCRMFYPVVKKLLQDFDGKVQLVVRYAPFHQNSKIAIRALEATRKQGRYWDALEMLFYTQPLWGNHHNPQPDLIFEYLDKLGIDMDQLHKDKKDPAIDKIIAQDEKDLRTLNIRATPTFFANGRKLERFSQEDLHKLVQEEVDKVYK